MPELTHRPAPDPSPGTAGDPAIIDLSILARLLGFDQAKVATFADKFLQSAGAGLAEMHTALAHGDVQRMRELGHRIKSAARIVGALGMATLCEQLEHLPVSTPQADAAAASVILARLCELFEQVTEHVTLQTRPLGEA